jgi:D-apiose dehydrogenase
LSQRKDLDLFLCDVSISCLERAKHLPNVLGSTDSFEKLLAFELDGLVVSTPEDLHVTQGIAACQYGVPLLIEKPVAENSEQALQLLNVVKNTGCKVLVGYLLRYAECMRLSKTLLDEGLIGTPLSFQIMLGAYETLSLAMSRFSSGCRNKLFSDYSHEWDYINWFLGDVSNVVATSHQSGDLELSQQPNVVEAILELQSGVTGTVHLDYVQLPSRRRITLVGDQGTLEISADQSLVSVQIRGEEYLRIYQGLEQRDDLMGRQLDHFIAVINGVDLPLVTVQDGLMALKVADALILASETRRWQSIDQGRSEVSHLYS